MMSDIPIQQSQSPGILWRQKNSLQKLPYAVFHLCCNAEDKKSQGALSQQLCKSEGSLSWSPLSLAPRLAKHHLLTAGTNGISPVTHSMSKPWAALEFYILRKAIHVLN